MKKLLSAAALVTIVVTGCIKQKDVDFKNLSIDNWQPDWALPIINANLTLKNVVKLGTVVSENEEGMYSLHYSSNLFSARASDYINIPDQNYNSPGITLTVPQNSVSYSGSVSDSFSSTFGYTDPNGAQLEHINVKSGNMNLNVTSTFNHNVTATVIFPTVLSSGSPLQISTTIAYPSTTGTATFNLAGYNFDLTNGGASKNVLPYKVRFSLTGTGQPIAASNNIAVNVTTSDIEFSFIDGYLGTYSIPIPSDTIEIGVFDNTLSANIFIRNPKIHLNFRNSFGLGVSAKFNNLFGLTNKGDRVNMSISPVSVNGASSPGQTVNSVYTIDSTNSTVQNLFNPAPNVVIYDGAVLVNPAGTTPVYSFVTDTSTIALTADAELPAWFKIIDFALQDTNQMVLPVDTSLLQKAEFKLLMDNAFPLYGSVQLYFADENYNFIDSLVPTASDIVAQAPVDVNGRVTGRSSAVTTFTMEKSEYNAMAPRVKYAVIRARLKTSGNSTIKILSSNNLIVKLAFRFKLNVSSTDL